MNFEDLSDLNLVRYWRGVTDELAKKDPDNPSFWRLPALKGMKLDRHRLDYLCNKMPPKWRLYLNVNERMAIERHLKSLPLSEAKEAATESQIVTTDRARRRGLLTTAELALGSDVATILDVTFENQAEFHQACCGENGRYLLFRLLKKRGLLLVSTMRVTRPDRTKGHSPFATFSTIRKAGRAPERTVQGIMYSSQGRVFTIGKIRGLPQIRTAAFSMTQRPDSTAATGFRTDLFGVRLGVEDAFQVPHAYRVCGHQLTSVRHLASDEEGEDRFKRMVGEFPLADRTALSVLYKEVRSLPQIIDFLEHGSDIASID